MSLDDHLANPCNQDLTLWSAFDRGHREVFWMKMGGQNMMRTGLQSLFVLLLVVQAVQYVGGQDLSGVLSALQGQAGEVLVKGDAVGIALLAPQGVLAGPAFQV